MFISLKTFVLVVFALSVVNAQKRFGSNCRNVNCESTQQCLGLYESCKAGLVEGSSCGFYATCVDLEGEIKHSERASSMSSVGDEPKPNQHDSTNVTSSEKTSNSGQLYPSLPQPNYPSSPQGGYNPPNQQGGYNPPNQQGGYNPPNQQGGYNPPNQQGGYNPPNQQGGYYPPNQQGGYYPPNPQGNPNYPPASGSSVNEKSSGSDSGFGSSILNFFSGGNRGSSGNTGGPDLGSLLSILGKGTSGNTNPASSSGSGGLDFSSLLSTFTGTGGRGSGQNTGQASPNPSNPSIGSSGQNSNQAQDSGPSFLQTLGNLASSPLGQQLLVNALQNRNNDNNNNAQQSRRFGGLFSENTSRTTQTVPDGAGATGYPTQPPYTR